MFGAISASGQQRNVTRPTPLLAFFSLCLGFFTFLISFPPAKINEKFHDLNPWQVCETLPSLLHWSPSLRAIERDSPWDTHAIHLLWQQLQVMFRERKFIRQHFLRTPGANVGLGKLPLWTLRLADYVMMSPALFNHLHQRGVYTYLWVLNSEEEFARCRWFVIWLHPEILGASSLDFYRLLLQGIQPRRYWRDDRLPFTTSKFSCQERQIIISPSAFTVMKPKSKKYE